MNKRMIIPILILTLGAISVLSGCFRDSQSNFISGVKNTLPTGWEMMLIDRKGAMDPSHGLDEPVFRIDFIDRTHRFNDAGGRTVFPGTRLYFYDINQRDAILKIIEKEKIYSWDIPDYFDETDGYIIVTSPLYINGGHFSADAMALYEPLEKALKDYFNLHR